MVVCVCCLGVVDCGNCLIVLSRWLMLFMNLVLVLLCCGLVFCYVVFSWFVFVVIYVVFLLVNL